MITAVEASDMGLSTLTSTGIYYFETTREWTRLSKYRL